MSIKIFRIILICCSKLFFSHQFNKSLETDNLYTLIYMDIYPGRNKGLVKKSESSLKKGL